MQTASFFPVSFSRPSPVQKRVILLLILCMAIVPRLYKINQPFVDLAGWRQTSVAMMADNYFHRNSNILYPEVSWNGPGESYNGREFQTVSYTASLLYRVFGQHEWVGRIINILFGLWGIFALYQLVRRLWDEPHAFLSAAVLAVLPGAIYFDRSFLPDPAMVSLVITSLWFFIAYLQTDSRRYFIAALLTATLGFLTKITGMIVLLPLLYATIVILSRRKALHFSRVIGILLPALGVFAVVAAYYLWARYLSNHYPPYHFAGEANWVWDDGLTAWLAEDYFLDKASYIFKNWILGRPFLWLTGTGIITSIIYIRTQKNNEMKWAAAPYFFYFWLAGYLLFYAIGAKELVGNFWNFHIGNPMAAAFCSSALVFLFRLLNRWKAAPWIAAVIIFGFVLRSDRRVLRNTFTDEYYKTDYQMGQVLNRLRQPGDLVVVLSHAIGNPIPIYYSGGRGWVFPPAGKDGWDQLPPDSQTAKAMLDNLRQQGAKWFAINREHAISFEQHYPEFQDYLNNNFTVRANEPGFVIYELK